MSVQHGDTRASPASREENQCSRDSKSSSREAIQAELAVAFIMATAFAVLVTETVNLLMSVLAKLSGNKEPDFSAWPGGVPVGSVDQRGHVRHPCRGGVLRHRRSLQQAAGTTRNGRGADPPSEEVTLLTEIRDELRAWAARHTRI